MWGAREVGDGLDRGVGVVDRVSVTDYGSLIVRGWEYWRRFGRNVSCRLMGSGTR